MVNFTGEWTLKASVNLDEFLKDEGWLSSRIEAAKSAKSYQKIVQSESSIKVKVLNIQGEYEYEASLDGKEIIYKDCDEEERKSRCIWNESKTKIIETIIKGKKQKVYTVTRYKENGEMRVKIENPNGVHCIRIFRQD